MWGSLFLAIAALCLVQFHFNQIAMPYVLRSSMERDSDSMIMNQTVIERAAVVNDESSIAATLFPNSDTLLVLAATAIPLSESRQDSQAIIIDINQTEVKQAPSLNNSDSLVPAAEPDPNQKSTTAPPSVSPFQLRSQVCNDTINYEVTVTNHANIAVVTSLEKMGMIPDEFPQLVQLNNSLPGYATCKHQEVRFSGHFAHLMQQFYRCWSFWQSQPEKVPVWFSEPLGRPYWQKALQSSFNQKLMELLPKLGIRQITSDQLDVLHNNQTEVITRDPVYANGSMSYSSRPSYAQGEPCYQTMSTDHMKSFRAAMLKALEVSETGTEPNAVSNYGCQSRNVKIQNITQPIPRIAMLNRRRTRRILNDQEIVDDLTTYLQLPYKIPIFHFEGKPLQYQVETLSKIDILVTPHGAQETNIVFLPSCGAVLEVVPENYWYTTFFGTLAASSGLDHSSLYLAHNISSKEFSLDWRNPTFCVPPQSMREGVERLVERWQGVARLVDVVLQYTVFQAHRFDILRSIC